MAEGFDITCEDGYVIAVRSNWEVGDPVLRCTVNAAPKSFKVEREGLGYILHHLGAEVRVLVHTRAAARLARLMPVKVPPDMSMYLLSPMPGLLRSVAVTEGQSLESGAELCVVEAMKMENILRSTRPVKIANLRARPADILTVGQVILEYESGAQASA
jgi:propionyl-CoA carboxylase alpha chain